MLGHVVGFIASPVKEWGKVSQENDSVGRIFYLLLLALFPVVAWYYGVTETGWQVADGEIVRMTGASAINIVALFYLAMVGSVCVIGYSVHWMASSYGANSSIHKAIVLVGYCATPMFIAGGLVGFYPILWLDMLVGVAAVTYSLYLLYIGIPIVMGIPKERGYLFASAVLAVCLVILMAMMGATVVLWELGIAPVFID